MLTPNIETFIACESSYEEAQTVLFGAPYDSTTSYRPGTRFASRAIRSESFGLETYSPYQDKDLEEIQVFDSGDLELSFGRVDLALADIKARTQTILADNKRPFMIGGEHLVTLPAVEATFEKYPDLQAIQFDAHTDLREAYLDAKLSHATVIRRIHDFLGDGKIHQFGIRSGERAEFQFAKEHTNLHKYNLEGLKETVAALKDTPVYLTIDLDVFDPGVFPGTGTPEAGGIFFMEFVESLKLISQLNIVALDVNELSPALDQSGASTALACKVVRELLLAIH
ncbi:agmatinase [Enterococcus cecorum]|uniref:Agmatinase n=2 Tax=Enterococcus cecorum TaxID=44008 RepID=S1RI75_9ENTE|nr:agmatinase [Enterococcus cecorum]EOX17615.1 agmatinase [Enterococcus cecorum DSM 20682 = ATCC 43198]ESK60403.1 agmatinase [Enterococcus cecorum DSM 20682 = ATCC 43198]NME49457.1 agmatinase [Enterococcus cecorum]OJG33396.1 agmatinase [Enterococcus cecorum DSM 20682 = ATCC 43198]CAI3388353.1 agmatinase [Enterococcus cecorum DSM 20682 = ATCC 43198]